MEANQTPAASLERILFRFDRRNHYLIKEANDGLHTACMTSDILLEQVGMSFNDLPFYANLISNPEYSLVRLAQVKCRHSRYVKGVQAVYQVTKAEDSNGNSITTREIAGPVHFFNTGYYSYSGGKDVTTTLTLQPDEYIVRILVNQGEIVDNLRFITNKGRVVSCGGSGGTIEETEPDVNASNDGIRRKVVALAGVRNGVL